MEKNIEIINLPSNKFKNIVLNVVFPLDLDDKTTEYNLIASILRRGNKKYPDFKSMSKVLKEMYGATFDVGTAKNGEKIFIIFYLKILSNKYIDKDEELLEKAMEFMSNCIHEPLIEKDKFKEEYFDTEKENLRTLIESLIDDKDEYAVERAVGICCEGEPYSIYKYGNIESLDKINNSNLVKLWKNIINNNKMYFICSGDIKDNEISELVKKYFSLREINKDENIGSIIKSKEISLKEVVEKSNTNQGKLVLCYRSEENIFDGDYFATMIMNSILGGGTHSKLFNTVREKHSLAYYSNSFIDKFKGILFIECGIDKENYIKTKEICISCVKEIQEGHISEYEFVSSKNKIINDLISLEDSQSMFVNYIGSLRIFDIEFTVDYIIDELRKVDLNRVIEYSNKLKLDTIYFLENEGEIDED